MARSLGSQPPHGDGRPAGCDFDALGMRAEALASSLWEGAADVSSTAERARQRRMHELLASPEGPLLAVLMADRTCRSRDDARVTDLAAHLLRELGIPSGGFSAWERLGLRALGPLRRLAPAVTASAVRQRIRSQASGMLLDADTHVLGQRLAQRHREGSQVNVNWLGEALVGEEEAQRRVQTYCELASRPGVDAISVKVSSIGSQLSLLAFEQTVQTLSERLGAIYAAAGSHTLVYLDMEAYDELDLTLQTMARALTFPGCESTRVGLVIQAYLPDAHGLFEEVLALSEARVAAGSTPLTVRFVKGANLATERVQASLRGWALPIYPDKASVDASYRVLLERALRPEHIDALRVGVASHNVFDLALALCLAHERACSQVMHVELLEGMADALRRVLAARGVPTLVYAPVVEAEGFHSAVAYLVRRLDENASDGNFLRRAFGMRVDGPAFALERSRFRAGLARIEGLSREPRAAGEPYADRSIASLEDPTGFRNEPNTDFSTRANRRWVGRIVEQQWSLSRETLHSVIDGQREGEREVDGHDPSRPDHVPYRVALAGVASLDRAVDVARRDGSGWAHLSTRERAECLRGVARLLRRARGELLGLMLADAGKALSESDPEVSEAIDFADYYAHSAVEVERRTGAQLGPRGVTLVASPWNFPLAIPLGGTLAALLSGNRVLLKPAPQTPWVASRLAELCWQAGIPSDALQLLLCDDAAAARLSRDPRIDTVVLTGSSETARQILRARPELHLHAETGGKNALIVSAVSDREQAIGDAVQGAFGHAGQKCSATSLLICEAEVYDDPAFAEALRDAAASLAVGSAYDLRSVVTPLIGAPSPTLRRGLSRLDPGERWLLEPRPQPDNPHCYSPGIRWGVQRGSFTHTHELFGPVLSVMRARDLEEAIDIAREPGYGLTAGLHSLDEREHAHFARRMPAGNLYVNRTTTGAIVRRQPFGGMGLSSFGPGVKAGGPSYVLSLARLATQVHATTAGNEVDDLDDLPFSRAHAAALTPGEQAQLARRERDYRRFWREEFSRAHDPSALAGEANWLRYLPCDGLWLRVDVGVRVLDLLTSCLAASLCGCAAPVSLAPETDPALAMSLAELGVACRREPLEALTGRASHVTRIRALGRCPPELLPWAAAHDVHVAREPVHESGRVELLHYVREQALSLRHHRHGHLGAARLRRGIVDSA